MELTLKKSCGLKKKKDHHILCLRFSSFYVFGHYLFNNFFIVFSLFGYRFVFYAVAKWRNSFEHLFFRVGSFFED